MSEGPQRGQAGKSSIITKKLRNERKWFKALLVTRWEGGRAKITKPEAWEGMQ